MIDCLVPDSVVVVEAEAPWTSGQRLLAEEATSLGTRVAAKRRLEFTTGRDLAHRALATLGLTGTPIRIGHHREPLWPPAIVGSITHCAGYCAVAVAQRNQIATLGIDAELHVPLAPEIEDVVCTEGERRWIRSAPEADGIHWATLIFSAKESLYKAWFPLMHRWLDFAQAELVIDPERRTFVAQLSVTQPKVFRPGQELFSGRFDLVNGRVITAVVVLAASKKSGDLRDLVALPTSASPLKVGKEGRHPGGFQHAFVSGLL